MNTVVYYPYITPRPDWLKLAALCWDKVYRLVPPQGWSSDPAVVKDLDETLGGILDSINVQESIGRQEYFSIYDQLWRWLDEQNEQEDKWVNSEYSPEAQTAIFSIYTDSYGERFVKGLRRRGLPYEIGTTADIVQRPELSTFAVSGGDIILPDGSTVRSDPWRESEHRMPVIDLPEDVALHYLSLCASQAAKAERRDLVADRMRFTDAVFYDYSVRGEVATTILEAFLPEDFFNLEPKRIADFRNEFSARRLKYQTAVQDIVDQYMNTASEGTLESVKKQIEDLAKEEINETKKTYQRANQKMVLQTLGMSLTPPALATFIGSALGIGIFAPAGIVAAVSLFGAKLLLDRDEAKAERDKSPWSYVLDAAKM
jgi:hypothetical protein